jgi:hypothetical protein
MNKKIVVCGLIIFLLNMSSIVASDHIVNMKNADDNTNILESGLGLRDLGDLQFMYGIEQVTEDFQTIGCACDDQYFYITGGNGGDDPNKVYVFDFDGNFVRSFDQSGATGWGWLDLAWDGEYFYGGPEAGSRIDVFDDQGTIIDQISGPVPWCAGIAYDPSTDHLWTIDKWTDKVLYEIDMDGNIVNSWEQDKNVYGIAWDHVSVDGPFIWVAVQDPQCTFYQFDPILGDYTGVSFEAENPGSTDNKACGLDFSTEWNPDTGILVAIQQCDQLPDGPGDQLAGYLIYEASDPIPLVCCDGNINLEDIEPGISAGGSFFVENCGEEESELDWEIIDWPDWGSSWTFSPTDGNDLKPIDGQINILVTFITPSEGETEFNGKIRIVNINNVDDYCEIDVYVKTPRYRAISGNLFNALFNRFPILQQLLTLLS